MNAAVALHPSRRALARHLQVEAETVTLKPYGFDKRINWETYAVLVNGQAVGFTNEMWWNI
jgi:hypothetical protein